MHKLEYKILDLFKKDPHQEHSTSYIVSYLFPKKCKIISDTLKDAFSGKPKIRQAKQEKAKLHRQVLHHLNKLVKEEIIIVNGEGKKGEKRFIPNLKEGEELIIGKTKRKILISKPKIPAIPIEAYEKEGIITRYEGSTWIERVNSMVIECQNFDSIEDLLDITLSCFSNINDSIALNNFESLSLKNSLRSLNSFMSKLTKECEDYAKNICFIIDFTHKMDTEKILSFLKNYFDKLDSKHIRFIFDLNSRELSQRSQFFDSCIELFSENQSIIYIKNQALHNAPYFVGAAGPYTFNEKEWDIYKKDLQEKMKGIVCSHTSVAMDVKEFFSKKHKLEDMKTFLLNVSKALFEANSFQRYHANDYFKNIIQLNEKYSKQFFQFSRNYIRFWNYGWKEKNINSSEIISMIKESKEEVNSFCMSQETIYLSCGMPTRFNIAFSCAFKMFDQKILGGEKFNKIVIKKLEDIYEENIKSLLTEKERIFSIFDGGDRIRFFRHNLSDIRDIQREVSMILNTYKLPFFCYDFGEIKGDLKLTNFIDLG